MTIIHFSPLPSVEIPDVSITELVMRHAHRIPDRVAITDGAASSTPLRSDEAVPVDGWRSVARGFGPGDSSGFMATKCPSTRWRCTGRPKQGATLTTITRPRPGKVASNSRTRCFALLTVPSSFELRSPPLKAPGSAR